VWNHLFGFLSKKKPIMANNTSQEKAETKERTASPEKESKGDAEQTGTAGAKPLAAKSGYYYAHNQVRHRFSAK
jgi:hypothetical protein